MALHSFIAGTPLHVMISLSLIRQLELHDSAKLKIVDYFIGAEDVYRRLLTLYWEYSAVEVTFFPSHRRAYADSVKDGTTHLYLDSDTSFQRHLDLIALKIARPNMDIRVFEDGVGSYRTDLYHGKKKRIFEALGLSTYLGGSPFTNAVFVYEKSRYSKLFPQIRATVIQIEEPLRQTIARLSNDLNYVFGHHHNYLKSDQKCIVYLSSWEVDYDFIESMNNLEGSCFIKLHPHIKSFSSIAGVTELNSRVPAEIILFDLANNFSSVDVFHHGSSVEQYVQAENVHFSKIPASDVPVPGAAR